MPTQAQSLVKYLLTLSQQHRTGELIIESAAGESWKLYFYSGRLIYATGGKHPVRRWYRSLRRHCREFNGNWLTEMQIPGDYWEVDFINQAIQREQLSLYQAKAVIQSIVDEVIFTLIDYPADDVRWKANRVVDQQAVFVSVKQSLIQARQIFNELKTIGSEHLPTVLPHELPYLSPVVVNSKGLQINLSADKYERMSRWMQGTITLWDMAAQTHRSLPEVIKLLVPLIYQGWIDLKPLKDITAPYVSMQPGVSRGQIKGLVACVDDSPLVSKVMAELLQPLGYEVLPITQPVEQISTLTQHRPDLIFLDLTMPNISGYELCKFLRCTEEFDKTPIIILTGRDSVIDRMRAKMVGANDFLAKTPGLEKVTQLIDKYVGD